MSHDFTTIITIVKYAGYDDEYRLVVESPSSTFHFELNEELLQDMINLAERTGNVHAIWSGKHHSDSAIIQRCEDSMILSLAGSYDGRRTSGEIKFPVIEFLRKAKNKTGYVSEPYPGLEDIYPDVQCGTQEAYDQTTDSR